MYLSGRAGELLELYVQFARDLAKAHPEHAATIAGLDQLVAAGEIFKAFREVRSITDAQTAEDEPKPAVPAPTLPHAARTAKLSR